MTNLTKPAIVLTTAMALASCVTTGIDAIDRRAAPLKDKISDGIDAGIDMASEKFNGAGKGPVFEYKDSIDGIDCLVGPVDNDADANLAKSMDKVAGVMGVERSEIPQDASGIKALPASIKCGPTR